MKSRRTIQNFIELRVRGKTYDEIVKKLGVSKPTLIKWGKLYKDEIENAGLFLTKKLVDKIARNNQETINLIAENLRRAHDTKNVPDEIREKYINKAFKKLGDIFKVKVNNIELTFSKNGDIKKVDINTKE